MYKVRPARFWRQSINQAEAPRDGQNGDYLMDKLLTMLVLALDFMPGYKRKTGALMLAATAAAVAYNNFVAPTFGLPIVPADYVTAAGVVGNAVLGIGAASAGARADLNRPAAQ
jgi:hypothetical protein